MKYDILANLTMTHTDKAEVSATYNSDVELTKETAEADLRLENMLVAMADWDDWGEDIKIEVVSLKAVGERDFECRRIENSITALKEKRDSCERTIAELEEQLAKLTWGMINEI